MAISAGCLPYIGFVGRPHPEDIRKTFIAPHPEDIRKTSRNYRKRGKFERKAHLGNLRIENKARGVTGQGNPNVEPG